MERIKKAVERKGNKGKREEELKGKKKLKHGILLVQKRRGPTTPSPTWRLHFSSPPNTNDNNNSANPTPDFLNNTATVSARKLCAMLWEVQPQPFHPSFSKMSKNTSARVAHRGHHKDKKKGLELLRTRLVDPPNSPPDQPACVSTMMNNFASSIMEHCRSAEKDAHALQSPSPASCASSMEGRMGESSYSLKTSTEVLKVLNRIWSLEEQQASNISLLKALKLELELSRSQIKELTKQKQKNRQELDDLMKQVVKDKVVRKNKEQDGIRAVIQSLREELEDERKLRKNSESLHRKLARDLSDVEYSFCTALKELKRERKARTLLENLCDEFARGITDYEQEVRLLRHKPGMEYLGGKFLEDPCGQPAFTGLDSPVQQGMAKLTSPEFDKPGSFLNSPRGLKENTLKAKLLEARLEDQKSRLRVSKGSFLGGCGGGYA